MYPALIAALIIWWLLRQRRVGSDIMDVLGLFKPAPKNQQTVTLAYFHWRDVRAALGLTPADKSAAALARSFTSIGLSAYFSALGYDWRALAAISLHETGYGTSHAAYTHDNLWGVSYQGAGGIYQPYAYDSVAHATEHLMNVLAMDRYNTARQVRKIGRVFLPALGAAGYNSSEEWRRGVLAAYDALSRV